MAVVEEDDWLKATASGPYCAAGAPHRGRDLIERRVPGDLLPPGIGVAFDGVRRSGRVSRSLW